MAVVNRIKLLGEEFTDSKVIEKVITLPEGYELKISSLEDSRDLSTISLSKLINAMYAQEQKSAGKKGWIKKKEDRLRDGGKEENPPDLTTKRQMTQRVEKMTKVEGKDKDEGFDDLPAKSIRPVVETYHKCDLALLEHTIFEEVEQKINIGVCCKMVKKECCKLVTHAITSSRIKCELVSSPKCKLRTQ
ncbi:hypothetical protein PVK06_008766 [Gossypium arboreum]|uniref:Uncharacterized protein n=1 Tax=Gossypium arboreum TaxID=29729 RepID=A0ABR0QKR5_GOSAR|nr:hypothetical protein PVK06_008766 [Gossypium arboreum]